MQMQWVKTGRSGGFCNAWPSHRAAPRSLVAPDRRPRILSVSKQNYCCSREDSLHIKHLHMQIIAESRPEVLVIFDSCLGARSPGRLLRRLAKLATTYVETRLAARFEALDLSFTQWIALKVVHEGVVTNAGELARELGITTGATTRLLDTLEEHGLLVRDRASTDRRVVSLALTDAGRDLTTALLPDVVGAWNEIFADVGKAEAEAFVATLDKLFTAAERLVEAEEIPA